MLKKFNLIYRLFSAAFGSPNNGFDIFADLPPDCEELSVDSLFDDGNTASISTISLPSESLDRYSFSYLLDGHYWKTIPLKICRLCHFQYQDLSLLRHIQLLIIMFLKFGAYIDYDSSLIVFIFFRGE